MANYEKLKLQQQDELYSNASIYRWSREEIERRIEQAEKQRTRATKDADKSMFKARKEVLEDRLEEIDRAIREGVYPTKRNFKGELVPDRPEKAYKYLAEEYQERMKRRKLSKLARAKEDKTLEGVKLAALKRPREASAVRLKELREMHRYTEGHLKVKDKVEFTTLEERISNHDFETEQYVKQVLAERSARRDAISRDPLGVKKKRQVIADKKTKGKILDNYSTYTYEQLEVVIARLEKLNNETQHQLTFEDGQRLEISKMCRQQIDKYVHDHRKLDDGPDEVRKLREEGQRKVREEVEKLKKRQREYKARLKTDDKILPQTKTKADDGMLPQ